MNVVFYKEQSGVTVIVSEGESTYKIKSIIPKREPQKIETEYPYKKPFVKGFLWSVDALFEHGAREFDGRLSQIKESEGEIEST